MQPACLLVLEAVLLSNPGFPPATDVTDLASEVPSFQTQLMHHLHQDAPNQTLIIPSCLRASSVLISSRAQMPGYVFVPMCSVP